MPDRQEILSSLYGAYRLACFDESGMRFFNITVEGFWRSFFAAILLAPFYLIAIWPEISSANGGFSFWAMLVHFATYAAGWVLFPLVAFFATDLLGLGQRFTALVVVVNWSSVLVFALFTLVGVAATLVQGPFVGLVVTIITAGLFVYHWFVIKTALGSSSTIAIAFLLFNFVLGGMLYLTGERLL